MACAMSLSYLKEGDQRARDTKARRLPERPRITADTAGPRRRGDRMSGDVRVGTLRDIPAAA
jgi:hypothetical protein